MNAVTKMTIKDDVHQRLVRVTCFCKQTLKKEFDKQKNRNSKPEILEY